MKRIPSLDLARGFTVLIMPSVHVVMLYSQIYVQQSNLGNILAFLAEGPGAQLFMLLMGISMTLSSRVSKKTALKRSLYFLLAAYGLNFLKFIVPLGLGVLPVQLLQELYLQNNSSSILPLLTIGDILHFATIAYLLVYIVYTIPHYHYWSLLFAFAIIFLSPLFWDHRSDDPIINYYLQILGGHPPKVFFPIFPWLVYPLIGLSIGYYITHLSVSKVFNIIGIVGIILLSIGMNLHKPDSVSAWLPFYRTGAPDTIYHLGIVLLWLYLCQWVSKNVKHQLFFSLLKFLSKDITWVYLIQWILVMWILPFTGYHKLGLMSTIFFIITISGASFLLARLINYVYAHKKSI